MRKDNIGAALVISLLLLMVSTVLAVTGMNGALLGERVAGNHKQLSEAFLAAEAGVARALAWLESAPDHSSDEGGYWILDSDDTAAADAKAAAMIAAITSADTNTREGISWTIEELTWPNPDVIRITSAGSVDETGTTRRITVRYKRLEVTPPVVPVAEAAYTCFGADCLVAVGGSALVDGHDWEVPDSFNCQGAGCNGTRHDPADNPALVGILLPEDGSISDTGNAGVDGNPATLITSSYDGEHGLVYWRNYLAELVSATTVNGGLSSGEIGTRAQPQISEVTTSAHLIGAVSGAGVLIVRANATLDLNGAFHFEGLILIEDGASVSMGNGNVNVFGAMVALGGNPAATDANFNGNISLRYSSAALSNIAAGPLQTIPPSTFAWQEL